VLRGNLLTQTPVIATSATLTVGKSFDAIARNIGFVIGGKNEDEAEDDEERSEKKGVMDPANLQILDVGSPLILLIKECFIYQRIYQSQAEMVHQ